MVSAMYEGCCGKGILLPYSLTVTALLKGEDKVFLLFLWSSAESVTSLCHPSVDYF